MDNEEIEKLKEAAFALAELARQNTDDVDCWEAKIAAVEAFEPKPGLLECWANVYPDGSRTAHPNSATAMDSAAPNHVRRAVHLREVTPAPEWERWKVGEIGSWSAVAERNGKFIATAPAPNCKLIADAHNLEMQRVTGTEGK